MTLKLTPEILAAGYDFLRTTPPFDRWNLPESEDVTFRVIKDAAVFGLHDVVNGKHRIAVSNRNVGHTDTLIAVVAHEMIHLHQDQCGLRRTHGGAFTRWADQVCRRHGFDPRMF